MLSISNATISKWCVLNSQLDYMEGKTIFFFFTVSAYRQQT